MTAILVVGEDARNREALARVLSAAGHEVQEATTGADALEVVRARSPELVILDTPFPDARPLVGRMRAQPTLADLPVVFRSGACGPGEAPGAAEVRGASLPPDPRKGPEAVLLGELFDLFLEVSAERDPLRLAQAYCSGARRIIGARYAAVGLLPGESAVPCDFFTSGLDASAASRLGAARGGLLGRIVEGKGPVRLHDLPDDPAAAGLPADHPVVRSFLGVPLATTDRRYGFLYLAEKLGSGEFSEEDERLALTLATQLGVAYEALQRREGAQRAEAELRREVAERQGAERALGASERRFRALIEKSSDGIALLGEEGTILYASPATTRILGYGVEEFVGRNAFDLVRAEDYPFAQQRVTECLQRPGVEVGVSAHVRHKDGSWRYLEGILTNRLDEPSVAAIVVNYRDATEARKAEEALRQSQERFAKAFRASPAATSISTVAEGRYLYVNQAFLQLLGYTEEEVIGRTGVALAFWENDTQRERAIEELREQGSLRDFEVSIRRKSGELRHVTVSLDLVDLDGEPCLLGFCHDITERKRAEVALRESQASLETAQAVAHLGSWVQDLAGRDWLWWSKETYRIFGIDEDAFGGTCAAFFEAVHEADRDLVRRVCTAAIEGSAPYRVEHRIVRPDGTVRWVHEQAEVARDEAGRPLRMIGTVRDVTETKQLEEQFRQAQKMEAVGRLAGGVAHDFNNMLGVILGYSELVLERLSPADPVRRHVVAIRKTSERAAGLTHQLLAFSRRQVLQPKILDLNGVVSDMARLLRRLIGEDVQLRAVHRARLGFVRADRGQIEQVIMNLAINARDAMPDGGRLTIETANARLDAAYASEHPGVPPGDYVMLAITDTGIGMDAETRSHIFEPFFTTKGTGEGTGLGLATAYGIVRQSDGHIWVYSEPGRGTSFKVYLPRLEGTGEPEPASHPPGPPPTGSETILLVEDEDGLREVAHEVLEELGYVVLEAPSAGIARQVAARHSGPIHLLLTDVVMPGGSGPDLARGFLAARPEMKTLFMSGYTDDAIVHHGILELDVAFLQKPFTPDALARKVREVLETSS